ncbi:hypothetical protein ACQKH5_17455 [Hyphomonas sp. NPDC076900]|uniref:hypothetical protein n=1 Tax=unclassified Hyphomonas TaxID=2630699 RepID=UPI003D07B794
MSGLLLKHLAYLGPKKKPASITLKEGLNVICGASDTGKSFIAESLDFMLGGGDIPRDVPERAGYDRARLLIESGPWAPLTLERSIEGGNFSSFNEALYDEPPATEAIPLRSQHSAARHDTVSHALLERIGLTDKFLRRNKAGDTRSLSFRDIARLCLITEEEIQRRSSPLLSPIVVQATSEYAAFKLLLTGIDDSALVGKSQPSRAKDASSGKIELLDRMIEELQTEINEAGLDDNELAQQLEKLNASISEQNNELSKAQSSLSSLVEDRGRSADEIQKRRSRIIEIDELAKRFALLDKHYNSDLNRLAAVHEAGSFFVYSDRKMCPLCGSTPESQHLDEECDGNVEAVIQAAASEIGKIKKLQSDLADTVSTLAQEKASLEEELPSLVERYNETNLELLEIARPTVSVHRSTYNELVTKRAEVVISQDKIERVNRLIQHRNDVDGSISDDEGSTETKTSITTVTLDRFSQTVERILQEWHYPNAERVFFDETKRDFQIGGKPRGSSGKGLRAISHAAVTIGLLEYCLENDLPHPGFIVLDSPLLAYWKPEGDDDDLRGTDIKERFYDYLLGFKDSAQIIIIENEHPPEKISGKANVIVFTKNPNSGRYGFFPTD